jgi:predicted nucleic acid-binding protein
VTRRWVVNASPIITLAKIDQINLLAQLCDEMVIPQGVAMEIEQGDYDDAALSWIRAEGQAFLKQTDIDRLVAAWDLGPGESHVLSWAIHHPTYEALLDDRAARKAAKSLQVNIRGTLSIILLAKQAGYIASARTEISKLVESGFRVSTEVLAKVLELAEE